MERFDCLIVGAGHAGTRLASDLRQGGFSGSVALLGEEPVPGYDRPSLSKDYLSGKKGFAEMTLLPPEWWERNDVSLRTGHRVVAVDAGKREVVCADGLRLGYASLVWAAGGRARRLACPGHDLDGILHLRDKADADALLQALPEVAAVAIVGGGYIGLEAAAVMRAAGKTVTLIEAQDRLLARVAAEPLSRFFEGEHRRQGVEILLGASVKAIRGADGRANGVELADGRVVPADLVLVGIGIVPCVEPLVGEGTPGASVDEFCRTALPDVFCIGDGALMAKGLGIRIESVQNANDQASAVARTLCGTAEPYAAIPWFWSNQYDLKLQTIGLNHRYDATVMRGDPARRSFSLVYLREGAVIALDCVNATKDYVQGRKLVEKAVRVAPERLADTAVPLKDNLAPAIPSA